MSYPNLVTPIDAFPTSNLSTPLDGTAEEDQVINLGSTIGWFEVDSAGVPTTNKLGQSGPFVVTIDSEDILCSTLKPNQALVYYDSTMNGRNYNSTSIASHAAGATVTLKTTSVQTQVAPTASPTFTGTVTAPQVVHTVLALTAVSNAATVPITSENVTVTNNSAATLTITLATTSAVDGQDLQVRVYDFSAASQTLTWVNTENSGVSVPTTSNGSTTLPKTVRFVFNGATSKWRCVLAA